MLERHRLFGRSPAKKFNLNKWPLRSTKMDVDKFSDSFDSTLMLEDRNDPG